MSNPNFPDVNMNVGVCGFFKLEAHQKDEAGNVIPGSERLLADWFPNLVLNAGLDMLVSTDASGQGGGAFSRYCRVGSGSTAPAETDVALVSQIAAVSRGAQTGAGGAPSSNVAPYFSGVTFTWQFGQGAAAGNLAEIGVAPAAIGDLFSRALIKDGSGNPTTITVLPIEFLTVTYQLRFYFSDTFVDTNINIGGVDYVVTTSLASFSLQDAAWVMDRFGAVNGDDAASTFARTYNGAFNAFRTDPSGASGAQSGNPSNVITGGLGTGAPYQQQTWQFTINQGNAAAPGVSAIAVFGSTRRAWFCPKCRFVPPLPKDNTKTMSITLRATFSRYVP